MEVHNIDERLARLEKEVLPRLLRLETLVAQLQYSSYYGEQTEQQLVWNPTDFPTDTLQQTPSRYREAKPQHLVHSSPLDQSHQLAELHKSAQPHPPALSHSLTINHQPSQPHPLAPSHSPATSHQPSQLHPPAPGHQPPQSHPLGQLQPSVTPCCIPIRLKKNTTYLPSTAINKPKLQTCDEVLGKYRSLRSESKVGKLAVCLAKEAFLVKMYSYNAQ